MRGQLDLFCGEEPPDRWLTARDMCQATHLALADETIPGSVRWLPGWPIPPSFLAGTRTDVHDCGELWRLLLDSWPKTGYFMKRAHGAPLRKSLKSDESGPSEGASQRPHAIGFWLVLHGCATTVLRCRAVA